MRALLFLFLLPVLAFAQSPELDSSYIPKNVHVTSSAPQSATLEWDKTDGATAYRVWYGISADNMDYAGDTPFPQFQKSHLMEGAKYFFAISAVIDTKESPRSAPLTCQLPSSSPQPWAISSMPPQQRDTATAADTSKKISTDTAKETAAAPPVASPVDTAKTSSSTATASTAPASTATVATTSITDTTKPVAASAPVATTSVATSATTELAVPNPNTTIQSQTLNSTPATANNTVTVGAADTTSAPPAQPAAPPAPTEVPPAPPQPTPAPVIPPPATPPQEHSASTRVGNMELTGSSSSRNCYTVQIEASKNLSGIQTHLQILEARGVDQARIEEFVNNGVKWYRLRAGEFTTREQAATKLASLRWTHKAFGSSGPLVFYNDRVVK